MPAGPPDNDPSDPLVDAILRLGEVADALAAVSKKLTGVARDVSVVRQQQTTHGQEIGVHGVRLSDLEERVTRLEDDRG
jgi:hypothetical protein